MLERNFRLVYWHFKVLAHHFRLLLRHFKLLELHLRVLKRNFRLVYNLSTELNGQENSDFKFTSRKSGPALGNRCAMRFSTLKPMSHAFQHSEMGVHGTQF